jgi:hypothetical protein
VSLQATPGRPEEFKPTLAMRMIDSAGVGQQRLEWGTFWGRSIIYANLVCFADRKHSH